MSQPQPIKSDFFVGDVKKVARELLGAVLCVRQKSGSIFRSVINETEAYDGEKDLACHASKGRTARTSIMYERGGVCYVYLCYGMHWMLNIVTGEEGYPAAVLIRGTEAFNGPGRLTKGLGVTGSFNGKNLHPQDSIWIEESEGKPQQIFAGPRIGVDYAGPKWSQKPYRFWFSNCRGIV